MGEPQLITALQIMTSLPYMHGFWLWLLIAPAHHLLMPLLLLLLLIMLQIAATTIGAPVTSMLAVQVAGATIGNMICINNILVRGQQQQRGRRCSCTWLC
jgi:hypothetical protein